MYTTILILLLAIIMVFIGGYLEDGLVCGLFYAVSIILILLVFAGVISLGHRLDNEYKKVTKIDLPKEISIVDTSDNLRGYWRNDSLIIEFK